MCANLKFIQIIGIKLILIVQFIVITPLAADTSLYKMNQNYQHCIQNINEYVDLGPDTYGNLIKHIKCKNNLMPRVKEGAPSNCDEYLPKKHSNLSERDSINICKKASIYLDAKEKFNNQLSSGESYLITKYAKSDEINEIKFSLLKYYKVTFKDILDDIKIQYDTDFESSGLSINDWKLRAEARKMLETYIPKDEIIADISLNIAPPNMKEILFGGFDPKLVNSSVNCTPHENCYQVCEQIYDCSSTKSPGEAIICSSGRTSCVINCNSTLRCD